MFFKHSKVSTPRGYFFKPAVFFLLFCFFHSAYSVEGVEFNQTQWNEIEESSLIAPHNLEIIKTKLQSEDGIANIVLMINSDLDQNGLAEKDLSVSQNINALKSYVVDVINDYWYYHDNNTNIDMMHKFKLLPELELMVNFDGLYELIKNEETKWIEYNHEGSFDTLQALEDISAVIPRATFDGSGVSIVILDSGVDLTHQDLGGDGVSECGDVVYSNAKVIGGANTVLPDQNDNLSLANDTDNPCPYEPETGLRGTIDHGTAMASFAAGEEPASGNVDGYVGGVAPGATVYGVLVNRVATDSSGISGVVPTSAAVERGMEFAIENLSTSPDSPIKVVSTSLSFGGLSNVDVACDERSFSLRGRIEMLRNQGVMHVSSSGNGSGIVNGGAGDNDQISFPACLTATVSVSSTDNNLQRSFFANTSEALDVYAPGTATGATLNHAYRTVSGTSISTPIVAGAVAVLQNAAKVYLNRYLTVDEALGYLIDNGSDVTVERDGLSTLVHPLINVQASVDAIIQDAAGVALGDGPGNAAQSCSAILAERPSVGNGTYWLNSRSGAKTFEAYCDMTTDGGGWTLVVAQYETDQVTDWNEGVQADYDPTLVSGAGFALNTDELPSHSQVAFGRDLSPTEIDYVDFEYTTQDIPLEQLTGLKAGSRYYIHRDSNAFYGSHNARPDRNTGSTPVWRDTLTFDIEPGLWTWAFSPNNPIVENRGFSYNSSPLRDTAEDFAWTVWVRGEQEFALLGDSPDNAADSCAAILAERPNVDSGTYWLNSRSGDKTFEAYCDMTTDGGGWTLVVAQFESNEATDWNEGIQPDYDPTLASERSFTLNSDELPVHSQVSFGQGLLPTGIDYVDFQYTTGDIPITQLTGLKTGSRYFIHRDASIFYASHNARPNGTTGVNPVWVDTLTFSIEPGLWSWAFSPNNGGVGRSGYAYDRILLQSTVEAFAWTVWVR